MLIAVISVAALDLADARPARVAASSFIAIPVTLALTLLVFYLYGYTLNRITLFALIFSIGILVDDAIVVVENIVRHYALPENRERPLLRGRRRAVDEVGNPTILATFDGDRRDSADGLRRRPDGSLHAADSGRRLGGDGVLAGRRVHRDAVGRRPTAGQRRPSTRQCEREDRLTRLYRRVMGRLLATAPLRAAGSWRRGRVLLLGSMALVCLGFVKVKMLPFDNKSEFQVIVDMPEGTHAGRDGARRRASSARRTSQKQPEVINLQTYAGTASPYNFNGLVRHYFLRRGPNVADIQVNLVGKDERRQQSHEIAKRVREHFDPIAARFGARVKVAEVPPGPPVLQTLVAEVYGPTQNGASRSRGRCATSSSKTDGVVDVDWYVEDDQPKYRIRRRQREGRAATASPTDDVARTLRMACAGRCRPGCCTTRGERRRADRPAPGARLAFRSRTTAESEARRARRQSGRARRDCARRERRSRTRASITRT